MSGSDRLLALALALALGPAVAATGCTHPPDVPDTPDVSHLLSAYSAPGGTVDAAHPVAWLETGIAQVELLGGGQADVVLAQIAKVAFQGVDRASIPTSHDGLVPTRVDGVATLQVACGLAAHEIADVAVAIVDGAIAPVIWGTSHGCPFWQAVGAEDAYDGVFTMYRYPADDVLVRVDGVLRDARAPIHVDFRLAGGRLETRIQTPSGDVIIARDGSDVMARAANGTFRCSTATRTCRRER